jgi:dihydrofolate reductase
VESLLMGCGRSPAAEETTSKHPSVGEALSSLPDRYDRQDNPTSNRGNRIFLIGGSQIYTQSLAPSSSPLVDRILLTRILDPSFDECDVFFPDIAGSGGWRRTPHGELVEWVGWDVPEGTVREKGVEYRYEMWVRA